MRSAIVFCSLLFLTAAMLFSQDNKSPERTVPKDRSKRGRSETVWSDKSRIGRSGQEQGKDTKEIKPDGPNLEKEGDCAGVWTRAVCVINEPNYQNMLVVPNATSAQDALRRGRQCRNDVYSCSYFLEGARLACAPFILCNALSEKENSPDSHKQ
jgi:hypothetical protein